MTTTMDGVRDGNGTDEETGCKSEQCSQTRQRPFAIVYDGP